MRKNRSLSTRIMFAAFLPLALLVALEVEASSGLRCPLTGRLVSLGGRRHEVLELCGAPDDVSRRTEAERIVLPVYVSSPPSHRRPPHAFVERVVVHSIEEWTYDFGPNRFVRYLTFSDGRLVEIADGPYGTKLVP